MAWNEKKLNRFKNAIYLGILVWSLTIGTMLYALLDGRLNPVVTPPEITSMRLDRTDDWTRVVGEFDKLRNCSLEEIRWYYGTRRSFSKLDSVNVPVLLGPDPSLKEKMPIVREPGHQKSSYLRVRLSPDLIVTESYAYVYHKCHGEWLWKTKSLFYSSEIQKTRLKKTRNPHP